MRFGFEPFFCCVKIAMKLCYKFDQIENGDVFFDLHNNKGHREQAIKRGASEIVTENAREQMALRAKEFYGRACDKMKIIGVVGTNGKTTIVNMLGHLLGRKCAIVGTLGVTYNGKTIDTGMTTPDPIEMHKIFGRMHDAGMKYVAMETSAHAIHYKKLAGIAFDYLIFTNISVDHLDFFKTFERYANTKIDFFFGEHVGKAVVNVDSEHGRVIASKREVIPYDLNSFDVPINLMAKFNRYNANACLTVMKDMGLKIPKKISFPQIAGRFNTYVLKNGAIVVIDYAHTPDGLEKVIESVRETCNGRVITVFGCGGDRDKSKRKTMGQISGDMSDFTVLTNDNPRYEKPMKIIKQIKKGVKKNFVIIEDRREAINFALYKAGSGDVVIIAGKGAEQYMEIRGEKVQFCDTRVILDSGMVQTK